jgi:death on curing protein
MNPNEPRWLTLRGLLILHREGLDEHGGLDGIRDQGLLESAMARPQNLFHYENVTDLWRLAASYAFGLARNHPFNDGNKRAAFMGATLFLAKNGIALTASQSDATNNTVQLAAGEVSEKHFAEWLKTNSKPANEI